jgi:hypothetical protein
VAQPPTAYHPRGFSFTEILFAIMILGIGFIMVAAMFPVAIQQTETSRQETVGAAIARGGVDYVQQISSVNFAESTPTATPANQTLCVLRPTVVFPPGASPEIVSDQGLYNAVYKGSVNLTQYLPKAWVGTAGVPPTPGTYVIQGEVWDFTPITTNHLGSESIAQVNGRNVVGPMTLSSLLSSMESENMVQSGDPRFGRIAFYKRDVIFTLSGPPGGPYTKTFSYAPSAQIIVVATQVRNSQGYTLVPPRPSGAPLLDLPQIPTVAINAISMPAPPSLQASRSAQSGNGSSPAIITVPTVPNVDLALNSSISFNDPVQAARAAEGAFVIVAANPPNNANMDLTNPYHGLLNGRIYRLGAFDPNINAWRFAPGYGPSASDQAVIVNAGSNRFLVYIIGRGQDPDANTAGNYTGLAQDIAVYSTFISCPSN